jgi:hypothetical protein
VLAIDAILADGSAGHFGPAARDLSDLPANSPVVPQLVDGVSCAHMHGALWRRSLYAAKLVRLISDLYNGADCSFR